MEFPIIYEIALNILLPFCSMSSAQRYYQKSKYRSTWRNFEDILHHTLSDIQLRSTALCVILPVTQVCSIQLPSFLIRGKLTYIIIRSSVYDVLSANVWFVHVLYIPTPLVLCGDCLGERELGVGGFQKGFFICIPSALSWKQSSREHQSSTENKNRHRSVSFQQWEKQARAEDLKSAVLLQAQGNRVCWLWALCGFDTLSRLGLLWNAMLSLYFQIAGGTRGFLGNPPSLCLDGFKKEVVFSFRVSSSPLFSAPCSRRGEEEHNKS